MRRMYVAARRARMPFILLVAIEAPTPALHTMMARTTSPDVTFVTTARSTLGNSTGFSYEITLTISAMR